MYYLSGQSINYYFNYLFKYYLISFYLYYLLIFDYYVQLNNFNIKFILIICNKLFQFNKNSSDQ